MVTVNYNEVTKKLNVSLNNNDLLKTIEKNNYVLFFDHNNKLVQYIISNYGTQKNSFEYHKKLQQFLGKNIFSLIK